MWWKLSCIELKKKLQVIYYQQRLCRYCFYSVVQKWVFRPAGVTHSPDTGPLPRAKFHVYRGRNVGIQHPKLSKFRILAINLPLRGDAFAIFSRNSQHMYVSIGSF